MQCSKTIGRVIIWKTLYIIQNIILIDLLIDATYNTEMEWGVPNGFARGEKFHLR